MTTAPTADLAEVRIRTGEEYWFGANSARRTKSAKRVREQDNVAESAVDRRKNR